MNEPTRRRFLHAAGASLVLPSLPSLFGRDRGARAENISRPDGEGPVRRFCCIYFPNGVSLPPEAHSAYPDWHWFPHETGADDRLTKPLEPLAPLRSELTILSGLSHPATREMVGHAVGDTFLTGADQSRGYANSISVDQVYANHVAGQTRFASLALSSDGGVGAPGRAKTMSFTSSGKPIPSLSSPRQIYSRLFGIDKRSLEEQRQAFGAERSVLDNVLEEARSIEKQLSARDRGRLDEYMTGVREIEQRLESADRWLDHQKPDVDPDQFALDLTPAEGGEDYIRVILDLMYAAMLTDSTRALTYQVTSEDAKGIGDRFPRVLGLQGHHALSHDTAAGDGYENWARYDRFLAQQLAYFLQRLRTTADPEGEGSMLDNTMVLYGCGSSRTHAAVDYPLILAGGSNMGLNHGSFHRFDENQFRMSDLYVTMLQRLGVQLDRFSDSTRTIDRILA